MWERKQCAICMANFGVHPKAKSFQTRQLCLPCRKEENGRRYNYGNDYQGSL